MRFKRRKPVVSWLPNLGQGPDSSWLPFTGSLGFGGAAGPAGMGTAVAAVVPDYPAEAIRATAGAGLPTLADFEGSGYRLRRIVGKLFVGVWQQVGDPQANDYPTSVLVSAGFIVLRTTEDTGAPLRAATPNDYSPLDLDNVRDPWIWRRSWRLANEFGQGPTTPVLSQSYEPPVNSGYGSAVDGPHIDQRTARRITAEERLFFVISAMNIANSAAAAGTIEWCLDVRYLTSPLRVIGNRRNASR